MISNKRPPAFRPRLDRMTRFVCLAALVGGYSKREVKRYLPEVTLRTADLFSMPRN